ncbi:hypothetical protein GCM10009865_47720 [Aeromicrobium ponti]|uniref:Uncharacterized protein n=1 Tax=Cytobacillus oceanisediminis TaxID=665099 RepID=A0A562JDD3_9BACI|nr:DUF389 domain-containing protein [Cytobacillus oceanisediminis]TWH80985.1 hypothetical protein IQ19_04402 [Cytobacillus oceanisediminis]
MKVWISLLLGLVICIILSYLFLDYNVWTTHQMGENSESNGFLIIVAVFILIYVFWKLIERKKES